MSIVLFWVCVAGIAYTYVGFPLLLWLRAKLAPSPFHIDLSATPTVSVLIAAHNEAASIGAKLDNVLSLDYPRDRLQVIIASDGSTDRTVEIARQFADERIQVLDLPRRGKAAALNASAPACTGEVLVFSDANSMFAPNALRVLAGHLAEPNVGGVAGDQRYLSTAGSNEGERRYWDFDRMLKRWQSAAGSVTSATGAIYAVRRDLFTTVPEGVTDDFAVSTAIVAAGRRLVFAENAVAYEPPAEAADAEFARKVRIITRGLRGIAVRRVLLNPLRYGFYSLQLVSHKVLRRLVAVPLLVVAAISPWLWQSGLPYQLFVSAQAAFYVCALLGWQLRQTRAGRCKLFSLPFFFCLVNLASLLAFCNVLLGRRIVTWQPQRAGGAAIMTPITPVLEKTV